MSADDWEVCPRCQEEHDKAVEALRDKVRMAYGMVDSEEYERLRDEAERAMETKPAATFREDYEFYGAEEGKVIASYSGECQKCGLSCTLTAEKTFWTPSEATADA